MEEKWRKEGNKKVVQFGVKMGEKRNFVGCGRKKRKKKKIEEKKEKKTKGFWRPHPAPTIFTPAHSKPVFSPSTRRIFNEKSRATNQNMALKTGTRKKLRVFWFEQDMAWKKKRGMGDFKEKPLFLIWGVASH